MDDTREVANRRGTCRAGAGGISCLLLSLTVLVSAPFASASPAADSIRGIVIECGLDVEGSNEIYLAEDFDDSTFSEPSRRTFAETTVLAVAALRWRTAVDGASSWSGSTEAALGDGTGRAAAAAQWRFAPGDRWTWTVAPRMEGREERTFGMLRRDARASVNVRGRRRLDDGLHSFRSRVLAERYRAADTGALTLLDRDQWLGEVGFARDAWWALTGDATLGVTGRSFPDSAARSHVESYMSVELGAGALSDVPFSLQARVARRDPVHATLTTRDRFWRGELTGGLELAPGSPGAVRLEGSIEGVRYHLPDSALYFDYQRARMELRGSLRRDQPVTVRLIPIWERLWAGLAPDEAYQELGAAGELERLSAQSWWSGRLVIRHRRFAAAASGTPLHSSYRAVELLGTADQSVMSAWRLRVSASWTQEWHEREEDDATGLYFLLEVRRVF